MDISVIIVTYNSSGEIVQCLDSVLKQTGVEFEVVVVDNASMDDTLEKLKKFSNIRVIPSTENLGFGRGNNLGFTTSCGRYVYLLNPDARLVGTGELLKLCRTMDANSRWGMAGTCVQSPDGHDESQPATEYPGQRHVRRDFSNLPGKIAWIIGASMIVRRELYEKLGGFDPEFFLYSEETDFCLRMREIGHEIGHIADLVVEHVGGASEDHRDPYDVSARKLKGLLLFRKKHYAPADCILLAKRDLRRAQFRYIWNNFLAAFRPKPSKAWRKSRNYKAIRDTSLQFIKTTG